MWNRVFLILLGVCTAITAVLTYYAWSWLASIGAPQAAVEGYLYHSGLAWKFLWISSIALLVVANAVLARSRRSWAMWATFIYFAVTILLRSFGMERSFAHFKEANGFAESSFTLAPIAGVLICIAAAAVVYANQFILIRLTDRMYPPAVEPELEEPPEVIEESGSEEPEP